MNTWWQLTVYICFNLQLKAHQFMMHTYGVREKLQSNLNFIQNNHTHVTRM